MESQLCVHASAGLENIGDRRSVVTVIKAACLCEPPGLEGMVSMMAMAPGAIERRISETPVASSFRRIYENGERTVSGSNKDVDGFRGLEVGAAAITRPRTWEAVVNHRHQKANQVGTRGAKRQATGRIDSYPLRTILSARWEATRLEAIETKRDRRIGEIQKEWRRRM